VIYQKFFYAGACPRNYYFDQPEGLAGGFTYTYPGWRGFSHCQTVNTGTWVRQWQGGNSFSLGGGVNIAPWIGINLSVTTSYDSARALYYSITSPTSLCGDNAVPGIAGQISDE
jgi:hypothetical protein